MNIRKMLFFCLMAGVMFSSCIKDEPLNAEADITGITVDGPKLIRQPVITNNEVHFYVNGWEDVTHLAPKFTLTEGATIEPASGTERDFTQPQVYTVTSQDGKWKKTYTVSFTSDDVVTSYHFDDIKWYEYKDEWDANAQPQKLFHIFTEKTPNGDTFEWGSGNAGYMITASGQPAESYPTSQSPDGYKGKCAKLQTVSTGSLGAMMKSPIAAGNLFFGQFKLDIANAAKSTHFGIPFRKVPKELVGYYKYKAGEKFTDKNSKEVAGKKDDFAIYAVFFTTDKGADYLDGTNSQTSGNIVMKAELNNRKETDKWTRFSIPFTKLKPIDKQKLREGKYSLAIIMSSSKDGATFDGAVGSTLYVDELQLFCE